MKKSVIVLTLLLFSLSLPLMSQEAWGPPTEECEKALQTLAACIKNCRCEKKDAVQQTHVEKKVVKKVRPAPPPPPDDSYQKFLLEERQTRLKMDQEKQTAQIEIDKKDADTRRMHAQADLNRSEAAMNAVDVERFKVQSGVEFDKLAEQHAKNLDNLGARYMTAFEQHRKVADRNDTVRLLTGPLESFLFGGLGNIFRRADRFSIDQSVKSGDTSLSSSSTSASTSTSTSTATATQSQSQDQDQQQTQQQNQQLKQTQPKPPPVHCGSHGCGDTNP